MNTAYLIKSNYEDIIPVVNKTYPEFLWDEIGRHPHWKTAECLISGTTGESYTYQNVHDLSKSFAAGLKTKLGLNDLDIVGILLPNCPEFIIAFLGIMDSGCIATLMNPAYKINELKALGNIMEEIKCIVTVEALLPKILELKDGMKSIENIILVDGTHQECIHINKLLKTDFTNISFLKGSNSDMIERIALILFSSGTTGPPKGVMITHSALCTNTLQVISNANVFPKTNFSSVDGKQERSLVVLPLFHIYGLFTAAINLMYLGAKLMILPKFEPKTYIDAIQKSKPTMSFMVPPLANFIANSSKLSREDFEETHSIFCGAAPLGTSLITQLLDKIGHHVNLIEVYGMTELSGPSHLMPVKNKRYGSIGVLLPNFLAKVVNPHSGKLLGPNEPGELCIAGLPIMKGYFKNEVATKQIIDEDGFLQTGDIVRYDAEGYFYVEDRIKEIIKCKGFQVSPSELENIIREHPKVADVAVFGIRMADEEFPRAWIVKKDTTLTENEIHEWVDEKVVRYKRLAGGIQFVVAIPKSPAGKILRKEIQANQAK